MRVDGIFLSAFFRPGGYANAKPGSIGRRRRPIAFLCRSGKLREKFFLGSPRAEKSFLAKTLHATFRSNRRRGREVRKPSDRRLASVDQCYHINKWIKNFAWIRPYGTELR